MRIKTENVKESLEPVDVDKAGSEASEEGTHSLSKIVAHAWILYRVFKSKDYEDLSRRKKIILNM